MSNDQEKRLAQEVALVAEIGRVIGSTLDIDTVYDRFAALTKRLIPFDSVRVNLMDVREKEFIIAYASGIEITDRKPGDEYPIAGTLGEYVVRSRKPMLFLAGSFEEMLRLYPEATANLTIRNGIRSQMSVPLFANDAMIGILHFRTRKHKAYSEEDLRMAERVGMQIAGAISNAQLFKELKKAENSLKESEERFRMAYHTSPDAININRLGDGLFVDINEGFTRLTGFTREETIGRASPEMNIWCDPAERQALVRSLEENGYYENLEAEFRRKDGSVGTGLMSARIIMLQQVPHILSITRDISDRKQAEEEKKKLEQQLQQAAKMEAIGGLAGGIAHDFNNILAAIMGFSELAMEETDEALRRHDIDQIMQASGRAKNLIKQILAFSRQAGVDKKPLDLRAVVRDALSLLSSTIPSTIEIRRSIGDKPCIINADLTQMHQVLINLCTNAAQAMGEKGGLLDVRLSAVDIPNAALPGIADLKPGSYIDLAVSDTGHGIDPAIIDRIFDPFFTTKGAGRGTGLGLSVVYGVVKNHDGAVSVSSQPGEGAAFHIYIPRADLPEQAGDVPVSASIPTGSERILFVDDEQLLVDFAMRMLFSLGYEVTAMTDSEEAFRTFQDNPGSFDLVITDMSMPHVTGIELARRIMEIRPKMPVILCTGYNEYITEEKANRQGIRAFVMKPFSKRELADVVRKILDNP